MANASPACGRYASTALAEQMLHTPKPNCLQGGWLRPDDEINNILPEKLQRGVRSQLSTDIIMKKSQMARKTILECAIKTHCAGKLSPPGWRTYFRRSGQDTLARSAISWICSRPCLRGAEKVECDNLETLSGLAANVDGGTHAFIRSTDVHSTAEAKANRNVGLHAAGSEVCLFEVYRDDPLQKANTAGSNRAHARRAANVLRTPNKAIWLYSPRGLPGVLDLP